MQLIRLKIRKIQDEVFRQWYLSQVKWARIIPKPVSTLKRMQVLQKWWLNGWQTQNYFSATHVLLQSNKN